MQTAQARAIYEKQRQDKLADDARLASSSAASTTERKAFLSYRFARVLENYAKACAAVGSDHNEPGSAITEVPDLMFPADIGWEPLGPLKAAEIRDFQSTIPLVKGFAKGDFEQSFGAGEAKAVYTAAAAKLGRKSWRLAESLRKEAGLPPFQFVEDGWDYAASLQDD